MDKIHFEPISSEEQFDFETTFFEKIITDFWTGKEEDGFKKYIVQIQDIRFQTFMTDIELLDSITCAIDLLEELKNINNIGVYRDCFNKIVKEVNTSCSFSEAVKTIAVINELRTKRIQEIYECHAEIRRVDGAYWLLVGRPGLDSTLYAVYDRIVDNFDDEYYYLMSIYFLIRSIMHMNCQEINNKNS